MPTSGPLTRPPDGVPNHKIERHHSPPETLLCYCVFDSLHGASPDNLPCRFGLEYRGLLCERIDAFSRLRSGLLDDNEFRESGHEEGSRFLEFFIAYVGE